MRRHLLALTISTVVLGAGVPSAAAVDIHAHRGGTVAGGAPKYGEESLRAYRAAAKHGFVLEVDAKLTEDGVPVAVHDATLDRTTNCSGELRTFTLSELAACSTDVLGSPGSPLRTRPAPRGIPIATIGGVLTFARLSGAEVNLEIKNVPTDPDYDSTAAFANRVMDAVLRSRIPRSQLMIQSFIPQNLEAARQRMPGVETSLLGVQSINEPYLGIAASNGYDWISPQWPVGEDYVNRAHAANLRVAPFTLDAAADVRQAEPHRSRRDHHGRPADGRPRARPPPGPPLRRVVADPRPATGGVREAAGARRAGAAGLPGPGGDAGDVSRWPPSSGGRAGVSTATASSSSAPGARRRAWARRS